MTIPSPGKGANTLIHLHAELLPNIRQVTLYISLPRSNKLNDALPEILLSESRRAITVSYPEPFEDVAETIKLPARVSDASRRGLKIDRIDRQSEQGRENKLVDEGGRRELSFRMQLDNTSEESGGESYLNGETDDYVPWTANDMSPSAKVRCKECGNIFLDKPTPHGDNKTELPGWTWKDLPSGNWAEMMDFWHCHKPDPPKGAGHGDTKDVNAQVKGYGAANRVVAIPGTVMVDVATFLVAEIDCLGLEKVDQERQSSSRGGNVNCSKCGTLVGVEDIPANGLRLFKASLAVDTQLDKDSTWESHSTESVIAAQLLELIERESIRRFVVHSNAKSGLLLWVFNPDLRYSSSSGYHSSANQRAMKIFFQDVPNVEELLSPETGKATSLSLEELVLPAKVFHGILDTLIARNNMLPMSARTFREWRVGLLHRFEKRNR